LKFPSLGRERRGGKHKTCVSPDNFFSLVCDIAPCVGNEGWGVAAAGEEEEEEEEGSAVF